MPRRARPWYRKGRSMWYTTHDGKQIPLGVTDPAARAAADAAHQQLLDQLAAAVAARLAPAPATVPGTAPPPAGQTVGEAVVGYLASCEKKVGRGKAKPKTVADYRIPLAHFGAAFGPRPLLALVTEAGCEEVEDWAAAPRPVPGDPAAAPRPWSVSTQNTYLGAVLSVFKWAGLRLKVKRPPKESRGADTCLTDGQFAEVVAAVRRYKGARGDLVELLTTLRETGARPQEVAPLEADDVDWPNACVRRRQHKTRRHTGQDRIVHLNAAALALFQAQRLRYGTGLLFRTRAGGAYSAGAIVRRCGAVSKRVGFRVIAYGLGRHSFATNALAAGAPDTLVAELLGHKGTKMLDAHYKHLGRHARELKAAAEQATRRPRAG